MQTLLEVLGSLRELGSEGLASGLALVVGRVVADGGVHDVDARLVGVRLPVVHPFALGPRIRAKEDDLLVAEGLLDEFEQRAAVDPLQPDLFAQGDPEPVEPEPHPVVEQLAGLDPDSLTPREALDALYTLKGLLQ